MSKENPQFMLRSTAYIMSLAALMLGLFIGSLGAGGVVVSGQNNAASAANEEAELRVHLDQAKQTAEKEPGKVENWIHLGNLYFDAQMPQESIDAYKQALVLSPGNADVWTDMGSMYYSLGRMQDAIDAFDQALASTPAHVNAAFNKGLALVEVKRVAEAAAMWRDLIRRDPEVQVLGGKKLAEGAPAFMAQKGNDIEKQGQLELALEYYNAALSFTPALEDALLHKAGILEKLGRKGEARPIWQALLQQNPAAKTHDGVAVKDLLAR